MGCKPKGTGPKPAVKPADSISYWNDYGGTNGVVMDDLLAKFTAETGIKIEQQRMGNQDLNAKLRITNQSGENPDVAMLLTFAIPSIARDGILDELDEGTLGERGFKKEDYSEVAWNASLYEGKRYYVPLDAVMNVMFLNHELFKKHGFMDGDSPKVPKTRQEVFQYCQAFIKDPETYGIDHMGAGGYFGFEELLWQNETNVFTSDFKKSRLAETAAIECAEYWAQIAAKEKYAPPIGVDSLKAFQAGKLGIWITGSWNITGLTEAKVAYTVAHVPNLFKKAKVWAIVHNYTLPKQGKKDDSKREAAWQMIKWFMGHADDWTLRGGVLAALKKVQADSRVQADPGLKVMAASAPDWQFSQPTPKWADWESKASPVLEAIWSGKTAPKEAMEGLAKEVDAITD